MPSFLHRLGRVVLVVACALGLAPAAHAGSADMAAPQFRVCADPNNMPFSNAQQQGFENKLAELVASKLREPIAYTWWAQRRGYVRNTLKAHLCDVIMGVPTDMHMVATTRPYYRSTYVFVSRDDRKLDISAMTDPRLRNLRIGVQLIGDNGFNTPPAHALGEQGVVDNVQGFPVYGDYRVPDPAARIVQAVEQGQVDIAAVWGPLAGYFAGISPVPLRLVPITDTERFMPLRFKFDISMGVRKDDTALRARLDEIISRDRAEIDSLLRRYNVPLVSAVQTADAAAPAN